MRRTDILTKPFMALLIFQMVLIWLSISYIPMVIAEFRAGLALKGFASKMTVPNYKAKRWYTHNGGTHLWSQNLTCSVRFCLGNPLGTEMAILIHTDQFFSHYRHLAYADWSHVDCELLDYHLVQGFFSVIFRPIPNKCLAGQWVFSVFPWVFSKKAWVFSQKLELFLSKAWDFKNSFHFFRKILGFFWKSLNFFWKSYSSPEKACFSKKSFHFLLSFYFVWLCMNSSVKSASIQHCVWNNGQALGPILSFPEICLEFLWKIRWVWVFFCLSFFKKRQKKTLI